MADPGPHRKSEVPPLLSLADVSMIRDLATHRVAMHRRRVRQERLLAHRQNKPISKDRSVKSSKFGKWYRVRRSFVRQPSGYSQALDALRILIQGNLKLAFRLEYYSLSAVERFLCNQVIRDSLGNELPIY